MELDTPAKRFYAILGCLLLLVVMIVGVGMWSQSHPGQTIIGSEHSASKQAEPQHAPVNSLGEPDIGKYPAPASNPCWKETERAVEESPADGGQSAMPQKCLEEGF